MKVAIIGSKYSKDSQEIFKKIIAILKNEDISIDTSYIDTKLEEDYSDLEAGHRRNKNMLKNSDILIAEATSDSHGIGFLIAEALSLKKPVLCLSYENRKGRPSSVLSSSAKEARLLQFKIYNDSNLKDIITSFLKEAKQKLDTKFILIIPAEIDRYLEWASKEKRMHKAQLVREAIDKIIEEDKDYQTFLNSL